MSHLRKSAASLGFQGDFLDPGEITRLLGRSPSVGVAKGELWYTSLGAEKRAETGSWRIWADYREPADLDAQIRLLLSPLSDDLEVWRRLSGLYAGRIFAGLFLGSYNQGIGVHAETVTMMGERGLHLELDIYSHETD